MDIDIKPEVNREEKREEAGGLAGLLGKLGFGGAAPHSIGAAGAAGAGGAAGGGLLATKAGIIALALIGTTVAGGVGVVGYKVFGPGAEPTGQAQSLFEARPASERVAAGDAAGGAAATKGVSGSLQMFVDANNKPAEGAGAADGAGATETQTADAPADQTVTASGSSSHMAVDNNQTYTAASKLKSDQKFGSLSKGFGSSGGGGSSGASMTAGTAGATPMLASAKGITSNMNAGSAGARAASGNMRGIGGRSNRNMSALSQLKKTGAAQRRAGSSQQAGSTYDNSGGPGGTGIGAENAIGGGRGVQGAGAGQGAASATPAYGADDQMPEAPPGVEGTNVTPYQAAINTAMLAITGALALCMLASYIAKSADNLSAGTTKFITIALGAMAAGLAIWAMKLGADIGGSKFGQPLQGGLLTAAAGMALVMSGICIYGGIEGNNQAGISDILNKGDWALWMKVAGGGALLAMAGAYMAPKKQYDASLFKDGRPPDWDHDYQPAEASVVPSEEALRLYFAAGPRVMPRGQA